MGPTCAVNRSQRICTRNIHGRKYQASCAGMRVRFFSKRLEAMLAPFRVARDFKHEICGNAHAQCQIVRQVENVVIQQGQQPQADNACCSEWLGFARENRGCNQELRLGYPLAWCFQIRAQIGSTHREDCNKKGANPKPDEIVNTIPEWIACLVHKQQNAFPHCRFFQRPGQKEEYQHHTKAGPEPEVRQRHHKGLGCCGLFWAFGHPCIDSKHGADDFITCNGFGDWLVGFSFCIGFHGTHVFVLFSPQC
jgi:hypothetical protein